jgi:DNA helicase-2/ATP-dependent DNA helicase PcrA
MAILLPNDPLDGRLQLVSSLEPHVRNAYVGLWETHRRVFGYTLLAELPYRAGNAIEDFDLNIDPIDLLVVDEYQDLNEADIRLIRSMRERGAKIISIGDDDQSIYGFRMAAPEGIQRFPREFGDCDDYELTLSQRCGESILNAATTLIETVPGRPRKPSLRFKEGAEPGLFYYLRFDNEREEIRGVADLVEARELAGVPLGEIVILVRSQVDTWARMLLPELARRGIRAVETDWIKTVFQDVEVRKVLARLRLYIDQEDSLAWWTLLRLENGISQQFSDYIYDVAALTQEKFGETLLRLHPDFPNAPTINSARAASRLLSRLLEDVQQINLDELRLGETGWGGWIIDEIGRSRINENVIQIFEEVGSVVPAEQGLGYFLSKL